MIKTIFNARFISLICLVLSIGMVNSCKKTSDPNSGKTELLSFGPTGAKHGDTLRFVGNNLNSVTEIDLTGAVVTKADFLQQTSNLILILVPTEAEQGFVTLKTPQGDLVSKTQLNLDVVSSVTSMPSDARPGTNITIKGEYMNWVTSITFADNKVVDSFVNQSLNELVVKVPFDAQTGPLIITYGGTDPKEIETSDTLKVALPEITSLSPSTIKHADNLTISGTDLDLATQVLFTGDATPVTSFVSQTATELVVAVPPSAHAGKVSLVAASGVITQSGNDLNLILPAIASMSPNPIDTLANLTITGTNLDLVSGISFTGGSEPVTSFVTQSATQLVVQVPAGTLKGKITLSVVNSTLTVQSAGNLVINGGLPPLADFPYPIYTDATQSGFQDWSYTDLHDFANNENVRQGNFAIKASYNAGNGYQGITFHNPTAASTSGYTKLEFSVFGSAGLGGKTLNVVINGDYGHPKGVTLTEGEWSTYSLDLSSLGSPATLGEVVLQSAGWGGTIYIDHVGLR